MNQSLTVVIDAMGGDQAPTVPVAAGWLAATEGMVVELVGPAERLEAEVHRQEEAFAQIHPEADLRSVAERLHLVPADEWITMDDHPVEALRRKPGATLWVAARRVAAEPERRALVSAGHTGAVLAAALFSWRRLPGVERPALGTFLPTANGGRTLLVDVGANVDCRPAQLVQFAAMGLALVDAMGQSGSSVVRPQVGLLNIGTEPGKGDDLAQRTYAALQQSGLPFAGNVEGMDVWAGRTAVVVCDGFVGNVLIKSAEGLVEALQGLLGARSGKPDASLVTGSAASTTTNPLRSFDWNEIGGAPLLGLDGVGIVAHGRSRTHALLAAVKMAHRSLQEHLPQRLAQALQSLPSGSAADHTR